MENEIWRPVAGYEGLYEVSNLGCVRALRWRGGHKIHIIHHRVKKDGYVEVQLISNKHKVYRTAHRLVAMAFIPNPDRKGFVDHIDCNRSNNHVDNLRWCTYKENANNPITKKRQAAAQAVEMKKKWERGCCEKIKRPISQFTLDGNLVASWESASEAARQIAPVGKNLRTIERILISCCRGKVRKAMGFIWAYKEDEDRVSKIVEWNRVPKSIRVKMTFPDGKVVFYDSINQASKETGIMNKTIRYSRYHTRRHISWELLNEETCYSKKNGAEWTLTI